MSERDWLAERLEAERPQLRAVAYRLLGSKGKAGDAVQEAWLRLAGRDPERIKNLGAWLATVVARVALNMLRARRSRPEESIDADEQNVEIADTRSETLRSGRRCSPTRSA